MSNLFSNPTSLLHKTIVISFDGEEDEAVVHSVNDEYMEVSVHPKGDDIGFYAELYFDDWPDWYIVEIKD